MTDPKHGIIRERQEPEYLTHPQSEYITVHRPAVEKLQSLAKEKTLQVGALEVLVAELKAKIVSLESGEALVLKTQEIDRLNALLISEVTRLTKDINDGKQEIAQLKRVIDDMLPKEPSLGDRVGFRRPRSAG